MRRRLPDAKQRQGGLSIGEAGDNRPPRRRRRLDPQVALQTARDGGAVFGYGLEQTPAGPGG
jgi:hypothetical protein